MSIMNILIITTEYPPYPIAGSGMYAVNLSEILSREHKITIVAPYYGKGLLEEKSGNITIYRIKNLFFSFINLLGSSPFKTNKKFIDRRICFGLMLHAFFRNNNPAGKYDIVHFINIQEAAFAPLHTLIKQIPIVVSCNDYYIFHKNYTDRSQYRIDEYSIRLLYAFFMKKKYQNVFTYAYRVIVNCQYTYNVLADRYQHFRSKLKLVYRGINMHDKDTAIDDTKYNSKKITFIGGNMERKGAIDIIRAAPLIVKKFPSAHITLVGTASKRYLNKLKKLLTRYECSEHVTFYSHLPSSDARNLIRDSNVFVMPSIIEALAQVYIESLFYKTPVVATNVGGTPEIINEKNGILIPPNDYIQLADAIINILSHPDKAKQMGEAGRLFIIANRTREKMAQETLAIYNEVLQSHG